MPVRALVLAALCLAAGCAAAQVPPDVAARNQAIGRKIDGPASAAIYGPLLQHEPYGFQGQISRDIPFGPAPLEKLDLFTKGRVAGEGPRPVLVFVHGGAFVAGDKAGLDREGRRNPYYDNVMLWAAEHGMVGVNLNYELAPRATYPTAQRSIGAAIAWVKANIAQHGGDPNRIFLMGHSAGGAHVAAYLASPEFYPAGGAGVRGAILVSPLFEVSDENNPYFVPADRYGKLAFTAGLLKTRLPLLVVNAELDPEMFAVSSKKFLADAAGASPKPRYLVLKDHGHLSELYAVGTSDESLTKPVEQFVKENR